MLRLPPPSLPPPSLAPPPQVVRAGGRCFIWGTVGWVLSEVPEASPRRYKHYVWLDSSSRGPFLPAYVKHLQVGGEGAPAAGLAGRSARSTARGCVCARV